MPNIQKRGKRTSTPIKRKKPTLSVAEEVGRLTKAVKRHFSKNEEEPVEYKEAAERLQQEKNDRIADAISVLQEIKLGDEYIALLDGDSAPKVLQAIEALPEEQREGNSFYRKRAAKKTLEPFRHYRNLENLLEASKKLAKGSKKAQGDYLTAFTRIFTPERLDKLKTLIDGDSSQEQIKAYLAKITEGLDQRAQAIDKGVSDTVRTFGRKVTEERKAIDQRAKEVSRGIKREKVGLNKHTQETYEAIDEKAKAVQKAIDQKAQEIDRGVNDAVRTFGEKVTEGQKTLDQRAKEVSKDIKREKTEFDRDAQESHWDIYSKGKEVEEDIKREKTEFDRNAKETCRTFDGKAGKAVRDLEKKAKEIVAFSHVVRGDVKREKTELDRLSQETQQAVENKAEAAKRALDQRAQETSRTFDGKAGKAGRDLERKAKEIVAFSHVVRGDIKREKVEFNRLSQETQQAVENKAEAAKRALGQRAQEIDRGVNDTVRTFGERVTEGIRDLDQKVQEVRQDVTQGKAGLGAHTQQTYRAIDRKARKLYALEKRLGKEEENFSKKMTRAERSIDQKVQDAQKAMDKKVRKHQKPKRSYKKAALVAAAALGALGLYRFLGSKEELPKISVKPTGRPYRSVRLVEDGNYGEVLIADRKQFCKNPYSTNQRFYPIGIVAKIEAGKQVPLKGVKWIRFRTDRYEGGADVNKDNQKDLIDSNGNTYTSHPRVRTIFTGGRLHK